MVVCLCFLCGLGVEGRGFDLRSSGVEWGGVGCWGSIVVGADCAVRWVEEVRGFVSCCDVCPQEIVGLGCYLYFASGII